MKIKKRNCKNETGKTKLEKYHYIKSTLSYVYKMQKKKKNVANNSNEIPGEFWSPDLLVVWHNVEAKESATDVLERFFSTACGAQKPQGTWPARVLWASFGGFLAPSKRARAPPQHTTRSTGDVSTFCELFFAQLVGCQRPTSHASPTSASRWCEWSRSCAHRLCGAWWRWHFVSRGSRRFFKTASSQWRPPNRGNGLKNNTNSDLDSCEANNTSPNATFKKKRKKKQRNREEIWIHGEKRSWTERNYRRETKKKNWQRKKKERIWNEQERGKLKTMQQVCCFDEIETKNEQKKKNSLQFFNFRCTKQ